MWLRLRIERFEDKDENYRTVCSITKVGAPIAYFFHSLYTQWSSIHAKFMHLLKGLRVDISNGRVDMECDLKQAKFKVLGRVEGDATLFSMYECRLLDESDGYFEMYPSLGEPWFMVRSRVIRFRIGRKVFTKERKECRRIAVASGLALRPYLPPPKLNLYYKWKEGAGLFASFNIPDHRHSPYIDFNHAENPSVTELKVVLEEARGGCAVLVPFPSLHLLLRLRKALRKL